MELGAGSEVHCCLMPVCGCIPAGACPLAKPDGPELESHMAQEETRRAKARNRFVAGGRVHVLFTLGSTICLRYRWGCCRLKPQHVLLAERASGQFWVAPRHCYARTIRRIPEPRVNRTSTHKDSSHVGEGLGLAAVQIAAAPGVGRVWENSRRRRGDCRRYPRSGWTEEFRASEVQPRHAEGADLRRLVFRP